MNAERMKILEMIANRIITAEEGDVLLSSMQPDETLEAETDPPPVEIIETPPEPVTNPDWACFWVFPVAVGAVIAALGSGYSVLAIIGQSGWGWLFLTLPAMLLGLLIFVIGWLMRTGPWLRIHVQNQEHNIHLNLPVPTYWLIELVKLAQPFIPQLREWVSDDLLLMLVESSDTGLFNVEVAEKTGEYVRISYG
jgi:hypothetical protein